MKITDITFTLLFLISTTFILFVGKSILLPIIFAILFYFLVRSFKRFFDRIPFVKHQIPNWIKSTFATVFFIYILYFIVNLFINNSLKLPVFIQNNEAKIDKTILYFNQNFNNQLIEKFINTLENFNFSSLINPIINSTTSFLGNLVLVVFYLLFLLLEENSFKSKLKSIFTLEEKFNQAVQILQKIERSITDYIGFKSLISLISAIVSFFIIYSSGLAFPFLWASFIFVFNFIPVIGIFLSILIPSLFSYLQFDSINSTLILLSVLSVVQLLISNILEPKLLGKSLNISPLVSMIALTFWGAIWGIPGMIISTPITVIIIVLLANIPRTHSIAILLSNNGDV
ncbi:MAG: AI-2E family transporter [Fluviicola sp.]|nr:AI-2E family transporter [Fluviicola sp.]